MKRKIFEHELLKDLENAYMPLFMWRDKIDALIEEFGPETVMYTEAGKNDSQMILEVDD